MVDNENASLSVTTNFGCEEKQVEILSMKRDSLTPRKGLGTFN